MVNRKFISYAILGLLFALLQGCYTQSKITDSIKNSAENCSHLSISYYQSIDLIIKHIPYKTEEQSYHSEDKKTVQYISIRLKVPNSYVLIYPDYSKNAPISMPLKEEKLDSLILKKYKASRIIYNLNNQIYDCISQEYEENLNVVEIQKDNPDICKFINHPVKELLEYFNIDSSQTELTTPTTHFPEILTYYTSLKVKLNKTDSILINTIPNISIKDYDQLTKEQVSLSIIKQFPIGSIKYYYHKTKKSRMISCSCKKC